MVNLIMSLPHWPPHLFFMLDTVRTPRPVLAFGGNLTKPAYTAFTNYPAKDHDHKGALLDQIKYNSDTVTGKA